MPARNLSGSYHSIIFVFPGGKCLELLKTTIPSEGLTKEVEINDLSSNHSNNKATIFVIFIIGFTAGPAVSL